MCRENNNFLCVFKEIMYSQSSSSLGKILVPDSSYLQVDPTKTINNFFRNQKWLCIDSSSLATVPKLPSLEFCVHKSHEPSKKNNSERNGDRIYKYLGENSIIMCFKIRMKLHNYWNIIDFSTFYIWNCTKIKT